MPNIVECFFDIQEGRYYMFAPIEAFHDGLRETEKMVIVDLDFLKPDWYLLKKPFSSRCFRRHFSMTLSKSFIIALSKLVGRKLVVCEGGLSGLMGIQRTATFQTYGIKPSFNDMVKARAKSL